ncbi:MAG: DUF370 domain-containing protein [Lachnospiraceae bacterium]|nr:DUF370 domain-containing protein [Robinsoniella sp.]MDY3766580.1 DUF370 domain-containing protein [Lachnospiraceae bacterium]
MGKFVNIGFGNVVNVSKVLAVVNPDAAPIKRMVQSAKEDGRAIDATQGRKTKAVIFLQENQLLLSALQPETITKRIMAGSEYDMKGEENE